MLMLLVAMRDIHDVERMYSVVKVMNYSWQLKYSSWVT